MYKQIHINVTFEYSVFFSRVSNTAPNIELAFRWQYYKIRHWFDAVNCELESEKAVAVRF